MIVPRIPPELVPLVGGAVLDDVSAGEGDDEVPVGVGGGAELVAGGVCLDFEGVAEDGWLAGLDDVPGFAVPVPEDAVPVPRPAAPCLPWAFLCPGRDGCGVFTAGADCADGTADATAELTGGDAWCRVLAASMAPPPNIANTATSTPAAGTNAAGPRRQRARSAATGNTHTAPGRTDRRPPPAPPDRPQRPRPPSPRHVCDQRYGLAGVFGLSPAESA